MPTVFYVKTRHGPLKNQFKKWYDTFLVISLHCLKTSCLFLSMAVYKCRKMKADKRLQDAIYLLQSANAALIELVLHSFWLLTLKTSKGKIAHTQVAIIEFQTGLLHL